MKNARDTHLLDGYARINKGMPQSEILRIMGQPNKSVVDRIPVGSGWGEQIPFWIKIPAGDEVLEWEYPVDKGTITLWFARTGEDWSIAMKLIVPRQIGSN